MTFIPTNPDETRNYGPDVSFYQDDNGTPQGIDFVKMKARGAKFVYIRAGQNTWKDPDFETNVTAARAADLPWGPYWYLDVRSSMAAQAKIFGDLCTLWKPDLLPVVDYEQATAYTINGVLTNLKLSDLILFIVNFTNFFKMNKKMMIYTGYWYWRERGSTNVTWKEYPLWLAQYRLGEPDTPTPWPTYKLWQFTPSGPGISFGVESNAIDLNYLNGDLPWIVDPIDIPPVPDSTITGIRIYYSDDSYKNIK